MRVLCTDRKAVAFWLFRMLLSIAGSCSVAGYAHNAAAAELSPTKAAADSDVEGIVADEQGKPIAGAQVAVIARYHQAQIPQTRVLGETTTDKNGRFRLLKSARSINPSVAEKRSSVGSKPINIHGFVEDIRQRHHLSPWILVAAPGYGTHSDILNVNAASNAATIRLSREQPPVGGQLLDANGKPAVGVLVHFRGVRTSDRSNNELNYPEVDIAAWPKPAVTDGQGRFAFHNIGQEYQQPLSLKIEVETLDRVPKTTCFSVASDPHVDVEIVPVVKGIVTCQESGKPLANATVWVSDAEQGWFGSAPGVGGVCFGGLTNSQGQFSIRHCHLQWTTVSITPPASDPHVAVYRRWEADRRNTFLAVTFAVPRGIVLRGRVVEAGSDKAIQGVCIKPRDIEAKEVNSSDVTLRGRQDTTDVNGRF